MHLEIRKYFLAVSLLCWLLPSLLLAQPFSQLDFDRGPKSSQTKGTSTADKIKELKSRKVLSPDDEEVLRDLQLLIGEEDEEEAAEKNGTKSVSLPEIDLKKQTVPFEGEDSFIPPQLNGLGTDKGDRGLISSTVSWTPQSRSCLSFTRKEEVCSKAKGLKEVIGRFTGDDNFFDGVCPVASCGNGEVSMVTNLVLTPDSQVQLRDVALEKECRVELSLVGPRWQLIRAKFVECSCLPKDCK